MSLHWLWPAAALLSFGLTWLAMRVARRFRILDVPQARSSHASPVPRGGGVAVVFAFAAGLLVAAGAGVAGDGLVVVILGGGGTIALVGLVDDYRGVAPAWRLLLHVVVAAWCLYQLGGVPPALLPGVPAALANALGVVCVVWLINLYNFMDGIDGLAGIEAMTVCLGGVILHVCRASDGTAWVPPLLLLASVAGFLYWNYPPARIFLGDAGSGFLGLMMAVFCVRAAQIDPALFWSWIILLGAFIVDSSTTLIRRLLRHQRPYEAHRSHAYQFAARKLGGHRVVSLAVGAINLLWLLPIALLAATGRVPLIPAVVIACAPLLALALHFKAGAPELQEP